MAEDDGAHQTFMPGGIRGIEREYTEGNRLSLESVEGAGGASTAVMEVIN